MPRYKYNEAEDGFEEVEDKMKVNPEWTTAKEGDELARGFDDRGTFVEYWINGGVVRIYRRWPRDI